MTCLLFGLIIIPSIFDSVLLWVFIKTKISIGNTTRNIPEISLIVIRPSEVVTRINNTKVENNDKM
jgi:hypothetical protein